MVNNPEKPEKDPQDKPSILHLMAVHGPEAYLNTTDTEQAPDDKPHGRFHYHGRESLEAALSIPNLAEVTAEAAREALKPTPEDQSPEEFFGGEVWDKVK